MDIQIPEDDLETIYQSGSVVLKKAMEVSHFLFFFICLFFIFFVLFKE